MYFLQNKLKINNKKCTIDKSFYFVHHTFFKRI